MVAEYEKITAEIEAALFEQVEGLKPEQVKHGRSNLWAGISGFPHQIDVSVEGEKDVLLAEQMLDSKRRRRPISDFLSTYLGYKAYATGSYDSQRGCNYKRF